MDNRLQSMRKKREKKNIIESPFTGGAGAIISRRKRMTLIEQAGMYNTQKFNKIRKIINKNKAGNVEYEKEQEKVKQSAKNIQDKLKHIEQDQLAAKSKIKAPAIPNPPLDTKETITKQPLINFEKYKHDLIEKHRKYSGLD